MGKKSMKTAVNHVIAQVTLCMNGIDVVGLTDDAKARANGIVSKLLGAYEDLIRSTLKDNKGASNAEDKRMAVWQVLQSLELDFLSRREECAPGKKVAGLDKETLSVYHDYTVALSAVIKSGLYNQGHAGPIRIFNINALASMASMSAEQGAMARRFSQLSRPSLFPSHTANVPPRKSKRGKSNVVKFPVLAKS